jgi:two-component system CheB/CheR fusion protein
MPYRTQENRIDGVVITFTDVTLAKNLEIALRKAQADLEERFTRQTTEQDQTQKNLRTEINRRPRRNARAGPAPASDHKPRESRNE